jgi:tetratricopeptide (TPR) repeat protein
VRFGDVTAPGFDFAAAARFCNELGAYSTTIDLCRLGLARDPADAMLLVYRAVAHDELGASDDAARDLDAALARTADATTIVRARVSQALVRERLGDPAGALAAAEAAIAADPADPEGYAVRGTLRAWHGAWRDAWPDLEFHAGVERAAMRARFPDRDEWDGGDIAGRRIAVVHGQGLGDLIQTARYLPRLRERGAHVTLDVAPAALELVRDLGAADAYAEHRTTTSRDVDVYVRMMSLPRIFGETCAEPAPAYLHADPARVARWRERIGERGAALRVGLAWAGNPAHPNDRRRSIAAAELAPLAAVAGVQWVSLQHGPRATDAIPGLAPLRLTGVRDLADTAAIVAQLDLVIAVDTAVAHLAGALGVPAWIALPWRPDWRWSRASTRTPWYASVELVHADAPVWTATIAALAARLGSVVGGDHRLR